MKEPFSYKKLSRLTIFSSSNSHMPSMVAPWGKFAMWMSYFAHMPSIVLWVGGKWNVFIKFWGKHGSKPWLNRPSIMMCDWKDLCNNSELWWIDLQFELVEDNLISGFMAVHMKWLLFSHIFLVSSRWIISPHNVDFFPHLYM